MAENKAIHAALERAVKFAEESEFTTFFSESVLVRTHFVLRLGTGEERPAWDEHELEEMIVRIAQQWQDQLAAALIEEFGEERGSAFLANYRDAFPAGYRDDNAAPRRITNWVRTSTRTLRRRRW